MANLKAKNGVTITPKVLKVTKSDITNSLLALSDEQKVGLLTVTATPENLEKFTKDQLVAIVKVANPKFEVAKKTTKGEIIPQIMKATAENLGNMIDVVFTDATLMKLTRDVLDGIWSEVVAPVETAPAVETPVSEVVEPTATDVVITDESLDEVAEQTENLDEVAEQTV
jgi:hypothetical protein